MCLLTSLDKMDLVKRILLALIMSLRRCEETHQRRLNYDRLDPSAFYHLSKNRRSSKVLSRKYDSLFDETPEPIEDPVPQEDDFDGRAVSELVDHLDGPISIPLSHLEKSLLATIAQATVEADEQRRSLDICGLRYLISIRMFVNQDRRSGLSGTVTPASGAVTPGGAGRAHRSKLSFRNIVWATHSESQDVLLSAATACCADGKMMWTDAKRFGVFLWLKSAEIIVSLHILSVEVAVLRCFEGLKS